MQLAKGVLKSSARINPHGLGVVWLDTFQVEYYDSKKYAVLETERPFIAHFRYATVGAINQENTHPFTCGKNKSEWLMMNGTIAGLGNKVNSDTKVLAEKLGGTPRHTWKEQLEKYECRFVTINTRNRTFQVYNQDLWIQRDGVWYSKDNVLEDHLVAVYGTLKKGNSNYYNYLTGSKYIGKGHTKDKYPLIIEGLPYLIEKKGVGHNVEVDVFKVSDSRLKDLDRLEGHPNWYCRKQVDIKTSKRTLTCWVYFNLRELSEGKTFHETYTQEQRKFDKWWEQPKLHTPIKATSDKAVKTGPKKLELFDDFYDHHESDSDFDVTNEKPMCICCYHDLEHDGHSNYHCSGCGGWFSESEIIVA